MTDQFIVGDGDSRSVPPDPASHRNLAPVNIEGAATACRQAIASQVRRIGFDRVTAAEPQSAPDRDIERAIASNRQSFADELIMGDFKR